MVWWYDGMVVGVGYWFCCVGGWYVGGVVLVVGFVVCLVACWWCCFVVFVVVCCGFCGVLLVLWRLLFGGGKQHKAQRRSPELH